MRERGERERERLGERGREREKTRFINLCLRTYINKNN